MANQTRTEGPTPNGGAYSIAYWFDDNNNPVDKEQAQKAEIIEFSNNGQQISRTYAFLDKPRRSVG